MSTRGSAAKEPTKPPPATAFISRLPPKNSSVNRSSTPTRSNSSNSNSMAGVPTGPSTPESRSRAAALNQSSNSSNSKPDISKLPTQPSVASSSARTDIDLAAVKEELKKEMKLMLLEELNLERSKRELLENKVKQLESLLNGKAYEEKVEKSLKAQLDSHWTDICEKWSKLEAGIASEIQRQVVIYSESELGIQGLKYTLFNVLPDDFGLRTGDNNHSINAPILQTAINEDHQQKQHQQQQQHRQQQQVQQVQQAQQAQQQGPQSQSQIQEAKEARDKVRIMEKLKAAEVTEMTATILLKEFTTQLQLKTWHEYFTHRQKSIYTRLEKLEALKGEEGNLPNKRARTEGLVEGSSDEIARIKNSLELIDTKFRDISAGQQSSKGNLESLRTRLLELEGSLQSSKDTVNTLKSGLSEISQRSELIGAKAVDINSVGILIENRLNALSLIHSPPLSTSIQTLQIQVKDLEISLDNCKTEIDDAGKILEIKFKTAESNLPTLINGITTGTQFANSVLKPLVLDEVKPLISDEFMTRTNSSTFWEGAVTAVTPLVDRKLKVALHSSLSDLSDLKIKSSMAEEKFKNIDATMIESLKVSNGTAQLVETLRKDYLVPISNLKSIQNK